MIGGIKAHPQLGPGVAAGVEMEWVYVAMAEKRRDLRATLRNIPGDPHAQISNPFWGAVPLPFAQ